MIDTARVPNAASGPKMSLVCLQRLNWTVIDNSVVDSRLRYSWFRIGLAFNE